MRPGGGKSKGASFERNVCKRLSLWLSKGLQEDVLWRSAMSGGRSTVAAKKGKRMAAQAGDISCVHPCGNVFISNFFVECKNYKDLQFEGLLTGKGYLVQFWQVACTEAKKYNKCPLLVGKQNQQPVFVVVDHTGFLLLRLPNELVIRAAPLGMCLLLFDDFLKHAQCAGS